MKVLPNSLDFDFDRLTRDLSLLGMPVDFSISIRPEIKTCWGRYYVGDRKIYSYVGGLDYEEAFPHILHETIHHFQHWHQKGFKRVYGKMHDDTFEDWYGEKLAKWQRINRLEVSI